VPTVEGSAEANDAAIGRDRLDHLSAIEIGSASDVLVSSTLFTHLLPLHSL